MRRGSPVLSLAVVAAAVAACGDDHDHEVDHEMCFGDEDVYTAGMSRLGDDGNFKVVLLSADPDPLVVGDNSFVVRVTDAADAPVDGVTFDPLETWQRVHDHGTPVVAAVTALANPGEYQVTQLNVIHRGSWLFRFGPQAGGATDFIELNFGVDCPTE